jgi:thiol-disulfide isomerase/thioredoxin
MIAMRTRILVWGLTLLIVGSSAYGQEVKVKLKGGQEFSVMSARKQGETLLISVPRSEVETLNGKPLPPPVVAGTQAPAFSIVDLSGKPVAVPAKGQPTLVQFWASWCPHCRKDVPLMRHVAQQYQPAGLKVVSISTDQDLGKLGAFLQENPADYPVAALVGQGQSPQASPADLYEMQGVPHYFLIDSKGVITYTISGGVEERPAMREEFVQAIQNVMPAAPQ